MWRFLIGSFAASDALYLLVSHCASEQQPKLHSDGKRILKSQIYAVQQDAAI
jgi:hypothetical protein